ncbi:hypothetical protein HYR69_10275, partial [Candidatus Sumerlaeota bacterium]|nr:hypothetical protein [Candidatus Sumerlaeota bacterium]
MKPKLLIILLLIVLLPFGLIAWLGYRLARDEREMTGRRIEALLTQRLGDVRKRISEILAEREAVLLANAGDLTPDTETLREFPRDHSWTNQMFALDPKGELIYPAPREAHDA